MINCPLTAIEYEILIWCRRRDLSKTLDFISSQAFYGDSPQPIEAILDHIEAFHGPNLLPGFPHTSSLMTKISADNHRTEIKLNLTLMGIIYKPLAGEFPI